MAAFSDNFHTASDGIRTYYRHYDARGRSGKTPVLCLHGLTRNSADFEQVAPAVAATGREVIALDVRGRGRSDRDPVTANYQPAKYVEDVLAILDDLGWSAVISIGTSMGGLITMIMAALRPGLLQGVVLNDIGPELAPEGLARIQSYVGGKAEFSSWAEAAAAVRAINGGAFPLQTGEVFWLDFARRTCREMADGRIVFDYDPAISQAVKAGQAAPPDLWPLFDALAPAPLTLVRGALSDLLAPSTVAEMQRRRPDMRLATIADTGHAPLLTEPAAAAAIQRLLKEVS